MRRLAALVVVLGFLGGTAGAAEVSGTIERAVVTVEKRGSREWCVLDSRVSIEVPLGRSAVASVIEDWNSYPKLFSRIQEARFERAAGAVLLTEKVVVSAFGITNINRFTLRVVRTDAADGRSARYDWTQFTTDGTIDSLSGYWLLEDRGTADSPRTRVTYQTHSAVPVLAPGQSLIINMFLGGETKTVVETVVKNAASR